MVRWLLPVLLLAGCGREKSAPRAPWPAWALHHWVWEDESTQESALALVDGYLEHDIPVGAVIIDSPWETGYNTFVFEPALYPEPQRLIDELHARGVRVLLWTVSVINTDVPELYDEAAAAGYFMQNGESSGPAIVDWWKGSGSLIDYWNPAAVEWWHGLVDRALALGIDGWKTDGTDFFTFITSHWSPGLGRDIDRPEYSERYYRDFFDRTRAALGTDRLIMSRPVDNYGLGFGGEEVAFTPRDIAWAAWVGDQDATFAGLRNALNNLYESSRLGYVVIGSDIGGYREEPLPLGREEELFVRWAQFGAFCPLMENGGGGEHRPWMFSERALAIYRSFVELHMQLVPYMSEHGADAFDQGEPLMSFFDKQGYSFMLGPDLFVAPMLAPGEAIRVTFPPHEAWIDLFGDHPIYEGGSTHDLVVPLEHYPVFVRALSPLARELGRGPRF